MANPRFKKRGPKPYCLLFRDRDPERRGADGSFKDGWMRAPYGLYHDREDAEKAMRDHEAQTDRWEHRVATIDDLPWWEKIGFDA